MEQEIERLKDLLSQAKKQPQIVKTIKCTLYYLNGELHREDGPAAEYNKGDKRYYIKGNFIERMAGC